MCYSGGTDVSTLSGSDISELQSQQYEGLPVEVTYTFDEKAYVTFAYDSRIGQLKSILATGSVPAMDAFEKLQDVTLNGVTYVVYRQPSKSYPFGEYYKFSF